MEERFERESDALRMQWEQHDGEVLGSYLVRDVEDPRINIQSILTRHFLIEQLFGDKFEYVLEHELRFSLVMNWLLSLAKKGVRLVQLQAVLEALVEGERTAELLEVPAYISETFDSLEAPNYICDALNWDPAAEPEARLPEYLIVTFQNIWRELLEAEQGGPVSVLEPACGSANDYRFIDSCGISRFLDYRGFDLSGRNIANAKRMFPDIRFDVGNVLEIEAEDDSFDHCFVHDLFEHLSIEATELAVAQVCRVTRRSLCVGFFNMHGREQHVVEPVAGYHWNTLSAPGMKAMFERHASSVEIVGIDGFLKSRFGYGETHNKGAYTFLVRM